jgi:hypothetical protein
MGAGFVAASLLGSLAGQSAGAFQATFNMQVANQVATSRTFTSGGNSDLYTEMTVGSLTQSTNGTNLNVYTDNTSGVGPNGNGAGLCVIRSVCPNANDTARAASFSFSKPVELSLYNNFKVGYNNGTWSSPGTYDFGLALFYNGVQQGSTISLSDSMLATNSSFKFDSKVLVAANTAITVGLVCSGADCDASPIAVLNNFYISDVIVEVPAPLPLIGTGAAFAWTRRLRRRIKATPRPIMNG